MHVNADQTPDAMTDLFIDVRMQCGYSRSKHVSAHQATVLMADPLVDVPIAVLGVTLEACECRSSPNFDGGPSGGRTHSHMVSHAGCM